MSNESIKSILGAPVATYEEVAQEMGLTKASVRRIEQRALRKAQRILKKKGYSMEDFFDGTRQEGQTAQLRSEALEKV